jgi:hypothetical protein
VKPAATLVRKVSPPAEPPPPTTSKPMSKFALERQRQRETVGADTSAPEGNAGSGASVRESNVPNTAAASGGKSSGAQSERGATAAQGASGGSSSARKCTRIPPSKPVGEPMSVVRSHHPPSLSDTTILLLYFTLKYCTTVISQVNMQIVEICKGAIKPQLRLNQSIKAILSLY